MSHNAPTGFGKIIAKAWRDPAFKAELIANPAAALKVEGIDVPAGMAVTVLESTDKHFHLVLPPVPTDELADEAPEAERVLGEHLALFLSEWMNTEVSVGGFFLLPGAVLPYFRTSSLDLNFSFVTIIDKALRDPAFKAELIASPAAALKAEGIDVHVPSGMAVTVLENTDKHFYLVLPPVPTDEALDAEGVFGKHVED